jgi:hypothetical protein
MPDATRPGDAIDARGLLLAVACVVGAIALALVVGWLLHREWTAGTDVASQPASPVQASSALRLQLDPARDIEAYRAQKQALLAGYAWVDRERGLVRIPIEDAMRAIARGEAAGSAR